MRGTELTGNSKEANDNGLPSEQSSHIFKTKNVESQMSHLSKELIAIRPFCHDDTNFIYATWLPGLYYGNDWFRQIQQNVYFRNYHKVVQNLMSRPGVYINIACLKEDPEVVLGYAVCQKHEDGSILHWIFVKPVWRKLGIAKELAPKNVLAVTHMTKMARNIKPTNWVFDPFLV